MCLAAFASLRGAKNMAVRNLPHGCKHQVQPVATVYSAHLKLGPPAPQHARPESVLHSTRVLITCALMRWCGGAPG